MRVFVLGGGGFMGTVTVSDLVKSDRVSQVIVGDIKVEKAKARYAKAKIDGKVLFQQVDLNDYETLVRLIKGCNVAVSCVGPFYETAVKVARATIEAGVNFVDICDDWDGVQGILALDKEAKEAGVTLITGLGAAPGTVNLLAKYGASKLHQVDKILVSWVVSLSDPAGVAAGHHVAHMLIGDVPQFLEGELVYLPAGSGSEFLEFPEPLGKCEIYYVGHPEAVTIPLYIKGVKEVRTMGGLLPPWVNQVFRDEAEFGLTSEEPLEIGNITVAPHDVLIACRRAFPIQRDLGPPVSAMRVDVAGQKDGSLVSYSYTLATAAMTEATGVPASIGAQMLGAGEIKQKGVFAPEGCIEPEAYFKELAKRNLFHFQETIRHELRI